MKYRTPGPWGAGEAADLNPEDIDQNFWEHEERLVEVETNPPQAVSIEDITVDGNMMTIHLSNGQTEGPFALPLAKIRYTGDYVGGATMLAGDLFSGNGSLYAVLQEHVAPPDFDPELTSVNGPVYDLVIPKGVQPYDIAFFYQPTIPGDGQLLVLHIASRDVTILQGFDQSRAYLQFAAQAQTLVFPIRINNNLIGSIVFVPGQNLEPGGTGQFGTFAGLPASPPSPPNPPVYNFLTPGDRLTIGAPDVVDGTAAGLAVNLVGQTEQA